MTTNVSSTVLPSNVSVQVYRPSNSGSDRIAVVLVDGKEVVFKRGNDSNTVRSDAINAYFDGLVKVNTVDTDYDFFDFTKGDDEVPYFIQAFSDVASISSTVPVVVKADDKSEHGLIGTEWYCHPMLSSIRVKADDLDAIETAKSQGYIKGKKYEVAIKEKKEVKASTKEDDKRKLNKGLKNFVHRFTKDGEIERKSVLKTDLEATLADGWLAGHGSFKA